VVSYSSSSAACEVTLGDSWRVRPDTQLITELGAWLTPENVEVLYGST
jgi:DNA polymerase-3 subunit alpha